MAGLEEGGSPELASGLLGKPVQPVLEVLSVGQALAQPGGRVGFDLGWGYRGAQASDERDRCLLVGARERQLVVARL
jgi:hypothetical protein